MRKKASKAAKSGKAQPVRILVSGDVVLDHNIYQGERPLPNSPVSVGTTHVKSPGGAMLLYQILEKTSRQINKLNNSPVEVGFGFKQSLLRSLPSGHQSYALWSPCSLNNVNSNSETAWYLEEPLGYGNNERLPFCYHEKYIHEVNSKNNIIVLDDAALGFRSLINKKSWPKAITEKSVKDVDWLIYKMASPVGGGDLFRAVTESFQNKLILVLSIADLRQEEVRITKSLSWERTAQDLLTELSANASLSNLKKCRHLVVSFGSEGALWLDNKGNNINNYLIFDPGNLEGEWQKGKQRNVFGYMSCLCAALVNCLVSDERKGNIEIGIKTGLAAMRELHTMGHRSGKKSKPEFPFNAVAEKILSSTKDFSITRLPDINKTSFWSVFGNDSRNIDSAQPLFGLAKRIALFGPRALANIPHKRFGRLLTIDRSEIESLQGIQRRILDYVAEKKVARPLSLAVFGPPGSGKSFGIKQIAKSILGKDAPILEFNLSQFEQKPEELISAFHQVRDKVLEGNTPVVFWDEFDSKKYFWLQYLLAPMQDGAFRQGQIVHPIGKCIFVFAGGTSYTMNNFGPASQEGGSADNEKDIQEFKLLKGPDFISRLSGYLNVLGPNKRQKFDHKAKKWVDDENPADVCFPCRRSILIRAVLGHYGNEILDIDKGVLAALLEIDTYKHGARSLETILTFTQHSARNGIRRSDLPPREQMEIHVDYEAFMRIVKRDMPFKLHSEELAPAIHEYYRKLCKAQKEKIRYDVPYIELPEEEKNVNKAAAERIPEVLSHAGLVVVPQSDKRTTGAKELSKIIADNIEVLAEAEHDGWMEQKYKDGWNYGTPRDDDSRIHDKMIPYRDLSEFDKDKDRNAVQTYPDIVKLAGYKIILNK